MRATGWLRRNRLEAACAVFVVGNLGFMLAFPTFIRLPFFLTWIALTLVYGFRPWRWTATIAVAATLCLATVAVVVAGGFEGDELWGKLVTIPLLATLFTAMAWHAHRSDAAQRQAEAVAETRASLLERQRQFVYDASHELRTPVTIARGHLELLERETRHAAELDVALDELDRIERILGRLLLLARAEQSDFLVFTDVDIEGFLSDIFMRWSEVAERAWRFEIDVVGSMRVDVEAVRNAIDALLENAVKYTEPRAGITLRAHAVGGEIVVEVADEGSGVPEDALSSIFERFARADDARTRSHGGVGLGLSIVAAIVRAHGGRCTVDRRDGQTVFALVLPVGAGVEADPAAMRVPAGLAS
jgi:signal transduction histidine kinase